MNIRSSINDKPIFGEVSTELGIDEIKIHFLKIENDKKNTHIQYSELEEILKAGGVIKYGLIINECNVPYKELKLKKNKYY